LKLVSFTANKKRSIGVLLDHKIIDLIAACKVHQGKLGSDAELIDSSDMVQFLSLGKEGIRTAQRVVDLVESKTSDKKPGKSEVSGLFFELSAVKLHAPVSNPRKMVCLGLNYSDHAKEAGKPEPKEPILFSKPPTAIADPEQAILYPGISKKVDYEVELALVIGRKGKDIAIEDAFDFIAGYTVFNDVSARDIQFGDGQWFRGKSFDTFAPMGPYLVTKEHVPDPNNLRLGTEVNGEPRQNGTTANMIFRVPYVIAFISQVMTLEPGDIIATGTPAGVGIFAKPEPKLLKPGDIVEAWIENIGALRNPVRKA
jgi:2-keto-4-pentenoate hydratase/2-oxohepta-3-ene-1,7-dioic acid hydratase in catechol pathway